jgi:hypothetical protein
VYWRQPRYRCREALTSSKSKANELMDNEREPKESWFIENRALRDAEAGVTRNSA